MFPRHPAALVLAGAALLAGCGETDKTKIPENRASALIDRVDKAERACEDGRRSDAIRQAERGRREVQELPASVDVRVKNNLTVGFQRLAEKLQNGCEDETKEETPTPEPTVEETVTAAPTETPVPTETATPEPTQTPAPTVEPTVEPPATGGVDPGEEDG